MASLHAPPETLPGAPLPAKGHHHGATSTHTAEALEGGLCRFVTALMALFIVLWMMNASHQVKQAVRGYFLDPRGYTRQLGAGSANSGEGLRVDRRGVRDVRDRIEQALRKISKRSATTSSSASREKACGSICSKPNKVCSSSLAIRRRRTPVSACSKPSRPSYPGCRIGLVIEGHTDALPFRKSTPSSGYGNWDLAADRANTARRLLHTYGVRSDQVVEMRGFADRRLLFPGNPNDPRNRRVSLVVKFGESGG